MTSLRLAKIQIRIDSKPKKDYCSGYKYIFVA